MRKNDNRVIWLMRLRLLIGLIGLLSLPVQAQIKIGGNVYGGGNQADVEGNATVTVGSGTITQVFGGARMANIGGRTFVNIDGEHASATDTVLISAVYGGNDIAGTIGQSGETTTVPTELENVLGDAETKADYPKKNEIDNSWKTFVKTSRSSQVVAGNTVEKAWILIGSLFGGGNGDYHYAQYSSHEGSKVTHDIYTSKEAQENGDAPIATMVTDEGDAGFVVPELDKTYLEIKGGCIAHVYGGGNNATIKENTTINIDNQSQPFLQFVKSYATAHSMTPLEVFNNFKSTFNLNTFQTDVSSFAFNHARVFGGNNKAEMAIRPMWNLQQGVIRDLYSGGNRGEMTSPAGLLLELDPAPLNTSKPYAYDAQKNDSLLVVENVYGGCRMADVCPKVNGIYTPTTNAMLGGSYKFPSDMSARVLVRGGDINNVYGGNDITGKVYGGNAIGIYTSIRGNVYGGGNGAYAYTDNEVLATNDIYSDYYYSTDGFSSTTEALNAYRPHSEQISIRLKGTESDTTYIKGSVFLGGNCASVMTDKKTPMVELKMGSYVVADNVFLGNNGERMADKDMLMLYNSTVDDEGNLSPDGTKYSYLNMTDEDVFANYMEGAAMSLKPSIVFDSTDKGDPADYEPYTSWIGSLYCGGNVGSMSYEGMNDMNFDTPIYVYNKLVGGCNDAYVETVYDEETPLNAPYDGGIIGTKAEREDYTEAGQIKDRLRMHFNGLRIRPMRWNDTFAPITAEDITAGKLKAGQEYFTTTLRSSGFIADGTETADVSATDKYYKMTAEGTGLVWNTASWSSDEDDFKAVGISDGDDVDRRLLDGNVYGGCYSSGHVNGNIVININEDLIYKDELFAEIADDPYVISGDRHSGVLREAQGDDLMAVALTVFGGGCGEKTEVWGSTNVNLNEGYTFQVFGGGEEGVVGRKNDDGEYEYDAAYSCTVSLNGVNPGYAENESGDVLAESEYIYAGGNEGDVCGDTYLYLGNGRIYDAFGGSSNADILGSTEVYIGRQRKIDGTMQNGFPWVRDNVYGGNDFGGTIMGSKNHAAVTSRGAFIPDTLLTTGSYVYYLQGRVDSIFGGNYGKYDYTQSIFRDYTYTESEYGEGVGKIPLPEGKKYGDPKEGFSFPHLTDNSFVYFQPLNNGENQVKVVFGGSEGFPGNPDMNNCMQLLSYVLVDDTLTTDPDRYVNTDIYGGGAYAGVGSKKYIGGGRTFVDLFAGRFHNVYGGCNQEGLVGYTRVNVPSVSTVRVNSIFGGGKGYSSADYLANLELKARYCDHYVTCVDYQGEKAIVDDAIYGGNQNSRIAFDTYVNVGTSINQINGYQATIYGAGYGAETVSGRTNIYMNSGAKAYKVFGGGRDGNVFNYPSLTSWLYQHSSGEPAARDAALVKYAGYLNGFSAYMKTAPLSLPSPMPDYEDNMRTLKSGLVDINSYYNTNVHLMKGSTVTGYAYGGGYGSDAIVGGTTYVELLGGTVDRDIYGGGQGGHVEDEFGLGAPGSTSDYKDFVATSNVYIEGGMVRNVYGGGYLGHVGKHTGDISDSYTSDIPGVANVVIGKSDVSDFYTGNPAITRNVYGAGEGGSVWGTTNVTVNNGMIGYRYKNTGTEESPKYEYVEELDDQKPNAIELAGNVFGGGYVVNSYVDTTNVNLLGGTIRGCLYGGGEVGPIGRGTVKADAVGGKVNANAHIFKAGKTRVRMYNGKVLRNVFGGGRGKDSWGGDGTLYMDKALVATLDMGCKGYVFGQTEVNIYGGEVGTDEGMLKGYGNVFGGCDEGSVYSAYERNGVLYVGTKSGKRYNKGLSPGDPDYGYQGYYYEHNGSDFVTVNVGTELEPKYERVFTEDCKVVVEPWLQVKVDGGIEYNDSTYAKGEYVPTAYLNTLKAKTGDTWPGGWNYVDVGKVVDGKFKERGIIIHNAVFAGGNLAQGSSSMYVNETTVYGNATASIHDVYNRDFITIGTGHTGGLYGDGNLTFVDGYRELNITNYGSDKYHLAPELTIDKYRELPKREQDYYERKYKCLVECTDYEGTTYTVGSKVAHDELVALFVKPDGTSIVVGGKNVIIRDVSGNLVPNPDIWEENGVVSTYAGRIMNTIQRADFCGVFGSRMVMKGAQDRVPETVDYTNYTINRVREVSLNKMESPAGDAGEDAVHGNYFGIYSVVNYLGALSSDVKFTSVRTTNRAEDDLKADGKTFEEWKAANKTNRKRNNGNCHNHLALASGVYLELTTEMSTGSSVAEKDWGLVTGVIELDLINVQPGIGGGFIYAKNEHGVRSETGAVSTTLTALNRGAATQWDYNYTEDDATKKEWETSGNFVHSSQTIIDDCYNISNRYKGTSAVKAHYWYISGLVYVYDQYISAYTGAPNAYRETVEIPITINAASNGAMTLMDVQPNRYAFYSSYVDASTNVPLTGDRKLVINDVTYQLNDPISYWDWNKLSAAEKKLFVEQTYVTVADCMIGSDTIHSGTVLLPGTTSTPGTYKALEAANDSVYHLGLKKNVAFKEVFRSSNNMSHDKGYLLTYRVNNPTVWDQWYARVVDENDTFFKNQVGGAGYEASPTYYPTISNLYGQKEYAVGDIIPKSVVDTYTSALTHLDTTPSNQATFVPAHVVTEEYFSDEQHLYPGAAVPAAITGYTSPAYVSTGTIQLSVTDYIFVNQVMSADDIAAYTTKYSSSASDINALFKPAYYCTVKGLYGGDYYDTNKNYRALEAWSSLSESDRKNFVFNYDALDLLVDSLYSGTIGRKYQYDGNYTSEAAVRDLETGNKATYSLKTPIDYMATYNGDTPRTLSKEISFKRGDTPTTSNTIQKNDSLTRETFESLPNERRHYAAITVGSTGGDFYVVNKDFVHVETPYAAGTIIDSEAVLKLTSDERAYIDTLTFTSGADKRKYYYCREEYTIGEKGKGYTVTSTGDVTGATGGTYTSGNVPVGVVIDAVNYNNLVNEQNNFIIHGMSPMETSTLYVSRNSDINDLSTEKIITVIYKYDYEESDEDGQNITPVSERHVVNIHIKFKSGVPTIEDIQEPSIVLPGTSIIMRTPTITPGAYEILGGGWELFEDKDHAESHTNGVEYTPMVDSLYWYQDGFQIAYYAKTYLGKTYSNHVPVSVANYHDLKGIMDDKAHHLHVDYDRTRLKRDSKIYINDYSGSSENGLQLFKDFYDLSLLHTGSPADGHVVTTNEDGFITTEGKFKGHTLMNNSTGEGTNIFDGKRYTRGLKAGKNLEFFLRTDVGVPSGSPAWTSIADVSGSDPCFSGVFHGDGHTISGLDNSLFGRLCGSVYNLGVTGSFTSAGVADTGDGFVENCWINTTGTPDGTVYAVFGDPSDGVASTKQIVNSYYQEGKNYMTTPSEHGVAKPLPDAAFYNGTAAFNLNGFYLYKRYCDHEKPAGTPVSYDYYETDELGELQQKNAKYVDNITYCSSGYNNIKYVEERFADGDFRFAAGEIPTSEDDRIFPKEILDDVETTYLPVWPDDYLFFGQRLNYGYSEKDGAGNYVNPHQKVPTAIVKSSTGWVDKNETGNRVYRAPAYYGSNVMGVTHFNPWAYLAAKTADGTKDAYPGMTAVDFKGHNDTKWGIGSVSDGFPVGSPAFYPPLLVDDGLSSISNKDETRNLLVYAPSADANAQTLDVLSAYFVDHEYSTYSDANTGDNRIQEDSEEYGRVAVALASSIAGHLVQSDLTATNDHLLVDKQDFNCPISYQFAGGQRMWYQRRPDLFTNTRTGWEGISLPFTVETVSTNDKGEITHFYENNKVGHEYWLREYAGGSVSDDPTVFTADMNSLGIAIGNKEYNNTYLWDYYYSKDDRQDKNTDEYQEYYRRSHTYNGYPFEQKATPYIIGFPGSTFYEFDLSGVWTPRNRFNDETILNPGRQTITFASKADGITIAESDGELVGVNNEGFTFMPNYMSKTLKAYPADPEPGSYNVSYVLNNDGSSYDLVEGSDKNAVPFRPYFTGVKVKDAGARADRRRVERIVFNETDNINDKQIVPDGELLIRSENHVIIVTSGLHETTQVRITNVGGVTLTTFDIEPGQTIKTPVNLSGVYIVNKTKIAVK